MAEASATLWPGAPAVTVVGVSDERFDLLSPEARAALAGAEVVAGGRRHLNGWQHWVGRRGVDGPNGHLSGPILLEHGADADSFVLEVWQHAVEGQRSVCVLASGDPGFFGILRALLRRIDRRSLHVLPGPSSVALAFARLGLPWDDATVVSAHGRPLHDAIGAIRVTPKVAVLTSPASPPEAVGQALIEAGAAMDLVAVCTRLGAHDEEILELTLPDLAAGRFDPLSVVVLVGPGGLPLVGWAPGTTTGVRPPTKTLAWGLPDATYGHRAAMITKAETRAVVLAKLALPPSGVLWDVGAGSGSVGIECALVRPGLTVLAVESAPEDAARVAANAANLGAGVHVVTGRAPEVLYGLPAPDRVFVGGGGIAALTTALERIRPGGRVVATFAALDRAAQAADLLGNLVQLQAAPAQRLPDGGWRLTARNPVFVAWGPDEDEKSELGEPLTDSENAPMPE
jgi:precorrin-6B C5,15-methyltransferase / cobalt-precorrin-6B C5,C15-methyltransferase